MPGWAHEGEAVVRDRLDRAPAASRAASQLVGPGRSCPRRAAISVVELLDPVEVGGVVDALEIARARRARPRGAGRSAACNASSRCSFSGCPRCAVGWSRARSGWLTSSIRACVEAARETRRARARGRPTRPACQSGSRSGTVGSGASASKRRDPPVEQQRLRLRREASGGEHRVERRRTPSSSEAAVFSPTPRAPGILSDGSPRSAMKSRDLRAGRRRSARGPRPARCGRARTRRGRVAGSWSGRSRSGTRRDRRWRRARVPPRASSVAAAAPRKSSAS